MAQSKGILLLLFILLGLLYHCNSQVNPILGCLQYASNTSCKTCNSKLNWQLDAGTCKCKKDHTNPVGCQSCVKTKGGSKGSKKSGSGSGSSSSSGSGSGSGSGSHNVNFANLVGSGKSGSGKGSKDKCRFSWSGSSKTKKLSKCGLCPICSDGFKLSFIQKKCVCNDGYYANSTLCSPCSTHMPGCSRCTGPNTCTACQGGKFYWSSTLSSCRSCSTIGTGGCSVCTSGTVCTECSEGWVRKASDNSCVFCNITLPGCRSCKTDKICLACNSTGHFRNASGKCICNAGYVNRNGICVTCSTAYPGCLSCTDTGLPDRCTSCDPASHFKPTPHASGSCECQVGYRLMMGVCEPCSAIPGCLTCNNVTGCESCDPANPNYVGLNAGGFCDCNTGFGRDILEACVECHNLINGCDQCAGPNVSNIVCSSCLVADGFYENPSTPGNCLPCIVGCTVCDPLDPTACLTCGKPNFQVTGTAPFTCQCQVGFIRELDECVTCADKYMPGCSTCDGTGCLTCFDSHFLDETQTCAGCQTMDTGCSSCTLNSPCSVAPCDVTCNACDTTLNYIAAYDVVNSRCTCESTHITQSDGCRSCTQSIVPNCFRCTDLTASGCTECGQGWIMLPSTSICTACDDPASFPTTKQGCDMCTDGGGGTFLCQRCDKSARYYPVPDGSNDCNSCTNPHCEQCENAISTCSACYTGAGYNFKAEATAGGSCQCEDGYYVGSTPGGTCLLQCKDLTPGCSKCDISTGQCMECSAGDNFDPDINPSYTCDCVDDTFALSSNLCQPCSTTLFNCTNCSSDTVCTTCDSGFYVDGTNTCSSCSSMTGCRQCSASQCDVAEQGYYIDSSNVIQGCTPLFPHCKQCIETACSLCLTNQYALDTPSTGCNLCSFFYHPTTNPKMVGCLECNSKTECTLCDEPNNFSPDGDNGCICADQYALNGTSCERCGDLMVECLNCIDKSTCILCAIGYQLNSSNLCQPCTVGCLSCNPDIGCIACDSTAHFFMNQSYCNCSKGYQLMTNNTCQIVCGDGVFMSSKEKCDDGNLLNGDGCSSLCEPEASWSCANQELMRSVCGYQGAMTISFTSITKNPSANQITITLSVGPNLTALSRVNLSEAFISNLNLSNPTFVYNPDGTVSLTYDYSNTLEGQQAQFYFNPSLASSSFYAVDPVNFTLMMTTNDNQPITYYNPNTYSEIPKFRAALLAGQALSYGILAGGLFCDKIIGIELFGVWQVAFFSISNIDNVQPLLAPLLEFSSLNGYNFNRCPDCDKVPNRIKAIHHQSQISSNFNVMLGLLAIEAAIAGVLYGISYLATKYSMKLKSIARRMLKEYLLMITLFNTLNIGYSIGIQATYGSPKPLDIVISLVSVGFLIASSVCLTLCDKEQYAEFQSYFRRDWLSQSYFQITIAYRFALGILMSQLNQTPSVTIFGFFLATLFFMYQIVNLPYRKGYQNYRAMVHQISSIFVLGIAMYYRSMKMNEQVAVSTTILSPAYLEIICLYACVGLSAGCLGYELYVKYFKEWIGRLVEYFRNMGSQQAKEVKTVESEVIGADDTFNKSNILWSEL